MEPSQELLALLEYRLRAVAIGRLALRHSSTWSPRKITDDFAIEQIDNLKKVTISKALSYYAGPTDEAEAALAYVIYCANKGLAHTRQSFTKQDEGTRLLEIAFRGIPEIVINRFYVPLNMEPPPFALPARKRATAAQH